MSTSVIFVYGTLKRGYGNYERLLKNSKFLGEAVSLERYRMYNVGFPCLIEDPNGHPVSGEIFEVEADALQNCDRLEGHPDMYCRHQRKFELTQFAGRGYARKIAWVYIYQHPKRFKHAEDIRIQPNANGYLKWHGRRWEDDLRETIIEQIRNQQREQGVHVMRPSEAAELTLKQLEAKYDRLEARHNEGQPQDIGGLYP